jgi:hypothetical protein
VCRAVILVLMLSLPGAASAGQLSLYGPFDQTHNGLRGGPARSASAATVTSSDVLAGCGRGRYRDPTTHQCRGPADLR